MELTEPASPLDLRPLLLEQLDELEHLLNFGDAKRTSPSAMELRYWRQIAGAACIWLRQGRQLEISATQQELTNLVRGMMAEASDLQLSTLLRPELMSNEQWLALAKGVEAISESSMTYLPSSSAFVLQCRSQSEQKC